MARNAHPGRCRDCNCAVETGAGYFHKNPRGSIPKWSVRCIRCVAVGKQARGFALTPPQVAALPAKEG